MLLRMTGIVIARINTMILKTYKNTHIYIYSIYGWRKILTISADYLTEIEI